MQTEVRTRFHCPWCGSDRWGRNPSTREGHCSNCKLHWAEEDDWKYFKLVQISSFESAPEYLQARIAEGYMGYVAEAAESPPKTAWDHLKEEAVPEAVTAPLDTKDAQILTLWDKEDTPFLSIP